ncbi:MAG: hypothetical protein QXW00_01960 [Candidatus Woesearchaeota archaeon]
MKILYAIILFGLIAVGLFAITLISGCKSTNIKGESYQQTNSAQEAEAPEQATVGMIEDSSDITIGDMI